MENDALLRNKSQGIISWGIRKYFGGNENEKNKNQHMKTSGGS